MIGIEKTATRFGEYALIPVGLLFVDQSYQRDEVSDENTRRLAANWDYKALEPLTVCRRGEKYFIIDGAQRMYAAKTLGLDSLPCRIVDTSGEGDEARVFTLIAAGRKQLTAVDKYRAAVVAGEPIEKEIHAFLSANGISVSGSGSKKTISFITKLIATWRRNSEAAQSAVFAQQYILGTYDVTHFGPYLGLWSVIAGGVDVTNHADKLLKFGQPRIMQEYNSLRAGSTSLANSNSYSTWGQAVLNLINFRRRVRVRTIDLPNRDGKLQPGMLEKYASLFGFTPIFGGAK